MLRILVVRLLILIAVSILSACSSYPGINETPLAVDQEEAKTWWRVKFRLLWPEGEDLDFSYHLLIADQILAPVLEKNKAGITLWRVHRRAS